MPDQTGHTALVTGANSGLGFWTSVELARHGARVLMACRDPQRSKDALARLMTEVPDAKAELVTLDLASLASIRSAADEVATRTAQLDILIANAGVMAIPRRETVDGFEMQFGTNHLGHFALVGLLLPQLLAASSPRVVSTSSDAAKIGRMNFDDLMGKGKYRRWGAYGQSKLANLLFTRGLAARAGNTPLLAAAAHPGYAATNLQSGQGNPFLEGFMKIGNRLLAQSDAHGAWPQEYAATMPGVAQGAYYGPGGFANSRGNPVEITPIKAARDDVAVDKLWAASVELTGVDYAELAA
jgi:NAD(P)-dependent dehydrogenase (short-subunit alcohol dehydrogenase family)